MRVLHLSAVDFGGAGTAALRLHRAMRDRGVDSQMLVWERRGNDPGVTLLGRRGPGAARRWIGRAWYRLTSRRRHVFRDQRASCVPRRRLEAIAAAARPDLVVVHYVSDFLSFADIAAIHERTGARVAFNLLDMGLLTGGCHYSWGCMRYRQGCGSCPALPGRPGRDVSARTLAAKVAATRGMDHALVVPSAQLAADARGAAAFAGSPFHRIPIGVDAARLGRHDRAEARAALDLPDDALLMFFGAQDVLDPRKGMALLVEALRRTAGAASPEGRTPLLLVAGRADHARELLDLGLPVRLLGYVDPDTLALAYCAADVFICPSIEDSGPMMVNEAMMSGTPVVGFPIGVLPDLVVEGRTGFLADARTGAALAEAIGRAVAWNDAEREAARAACRALALERCSLDTQVRGFLAIASGDGR